MANSKIIPVVLVVFALIIFGGQVAWSQCNDTVVVTLGTATVEPCLPQRINIPVYMYNPCAVGGFEFHIVTTQTAWLTFTPGDSHCADTVGSRISNWEMFAGNVHASNPAQIIVSGIADMPGNQDGIQLYPGDGLIFTIHLDFGDHNVCDSSQIIDFSLGHVSDTSGYILYPVRLITGNLFVLPGNCNDHPRGDANCSGSLNGLDVTYLVAFLKGMGPGYCCLCSGDANNSNSVNGIDVTYLVGYFKGFLPVPVPCH